MGVYDYQIIANLLAGKGEARVKLKELKNFLEKKNKTFRVLEIAIPTPISQIPPDGSIKIGKEVICIGGDGTVSETLGFMDKRNLNLPIFIIPTGTANFIAQSIGVRTNASYDKLLDDQIREFDLGICQYNNRQDYFLIGIGLGFEQKFLALAKQKGKKFLGKLSYFLAAFFELFRLEPITYRVVGDGKEVNLRAVMITILSFKPKVLPFLPLFPEKDIKADDGKLDIFYVEHKNIFSSFLGILFFHILGRVNFGLVKRIRTKELFLDSSEKQKVQIDGELKGKLPLKIKIIPGGCSFLV